MCKGGRGEMKRYRIGEFAQKLGVTPDFLKYCEHKGIITPQVEKNGYRYYGFTQASRILEYIKCKNQGMSAEEIRDLLHGSSYAEVIGGMAEKAQAIRKHMAFEMELLRYYEEMERLSVHFGNAPVWQVRLCEGFYFLPHSVEQDFIEDDRLEYLVRAWNACMPVVSSVYQLRRDEQSEWLREERGENVWGFGVEESAAQRLGLPVDGPVIHVPARRCFEVFRACDMKGGIAHGYEREVMARNGLKLTGDAYSRVVLKMWENGVRREYSVLYLPID